MIKSLENYFEKNQEKTVRDPYELNDPLRYYINDLKTIRERKNIQPSNLENVYLLSATYDGDSRKALLKLYDSKEKTIYLFRDTTGHKPYCLTSLSKSELENIPEVVSNEGFDHIENVDKINPFSDEKTIVTKIVVNDPLTIGGKPAGSIRDIIPKSRPNDPTVKVWEADIKYYENYIYDNNLEIGVPYNLNNGKLAPVLRETKIPSFEEKFKRESPLFLDYIKKWVNLLESPVPELNYAAVDIEVESPVLDRIPEPREAAYKVICATIVASNGSKTVLLLKRDGLKEGNKFPENAEVIYCQNEIELVWRLYRVFSEYPILVTFNGDEFDLRYLWHRGQKLGFPTDLIPIQIGREFSLLTYGIHIDLYKLFFNRAIQTYAFDQKYKDITLHDVASSLLGFGKISLEKNISELSYSELATYCLRDSLLTYGLAALDDHLTLKLIIALARIAKMPMEDVTRQGVSNWIRSMLYSEHRKRNLLIPTSAEILEKKGETATHAVIKGKKYRGAVVIEPKVGINFNVVVLDFSSLYPSIIKSWNLSYETVRCTHDECKHNVIPETSHWVCTKKYGLTSLLIGSLKDLRVNWYKIKSKDPTLPKELRQWYSIIQRTLKVVLNASYGVFGAEHFSLYCPPVAEATASIGRYAIMNTIKKAQELNIEVIYGDTDSVFLSNPTKEQIENLITWSKSYLNMDLDVDKYYRYTVFSTRKKNYVGVYPEGNVEIKGLTGKKRNTPEFLKKAFSDMMKIFSEVKSEDQFIQAKDEIKKLVKGCYSKLKNKSYSLEDLAFTVVLGKNIEDYDKTTPQHVKALKKLSIEEKEKFGAGSVIRYIKIRKEPGVKLLSQSSIDDLDFEKYVEHIQTTFEPILDALDISFNEIIGISKLERWA